MEFFTLNLAVAEVIYSLLSFLALQASWLVTLTAAPLGRPLAFFVGYSIAARPVLHCCICLERFSAVVHPVTFLRFKPLRYRLYCCVSVLVALGQLTIGAGPSQTELNMDGRRTEERMKHNASKLSASKKSRGHPALGTLQEFTKLSNCTMSSVATFLSEDQFTCSICLDMFTNPVSTPCGHSFCLTCISCYWDTMTGSKVCLCPICKESFRRRPELHINRTLKEITEQFKMLAEVDPGADADRGLAGRGLEFFCYNHQAIVCSSCLETAEHQGHSTVLAKREWQIKKSQLGINEVELKDLVTQRERKMEEIQQTLRDIKVCAERETAGSVQVFSQLVSCVERCQSEFLEAIEMAWRAAEHRAQGLVQELEMEIAELKKRSAALSQLAQTDDCELFLKTFPVFMTPPQIKNWSETHLTSEVTSGTPVQTVTDMMERFREELRKLPEVVLRPDGNIEVRRVQEYAEDLVLDPHTAHPRLLISVDGKQVRCGDRHQPVLDMPERFDRVVCVLARQGFTSGRHYWEVNVGDKTDWDLGVASRAINRKGKITVSPAHGFWFLSLRDRTDYAFRTEPATPLVTSLRPSRVGVFVDCDKGQVSFYDVEAKALIYTFVDTFGDAVHPFFSPCTNKSGHNNAALIICPVAATE
ncbi:hypothetical protein NHX12_018640 [Muraenolepis orangiensis]|uniref:Uncharacterized protein n=1 Tax=Muraenolepis orangiensis TaxID=630683 RepID=A0A9Q0IVK2_9TELE|nr:hypothetical protein NHX12_018640 [Muraenolepis orangiensis]